MFDFISQHKIRSRNLERKIRWMQTPAARSGNFKFEHIGGPNDEGTPCLWATHRPTGATVEFLFLQNPDEIVMSPNAAVSIWETEQKAKKAASTYVNPANVVDAYGGTPCKHVVLYMPGNDHTFKLGMGSCGREVIELSFKKHGDYITVHQWCKDNPEKPDAFTYKVANLTRWVVYQTDKPEEDKSKPPQEEPKQGESFSFSYRGRLHTIPLTKERSMAIMDVTHFAVKNLKVATGIRDAARVAACAVDPAVWQKPFAQVPTADQIAAHERLSTANDEALYWAGLVDYLHDPASVMHFTLPKK